VNERQSEKGHQKVPKREVEFTAARIPFRWDAAEGRPELVEDILVLG
jgi:hypothetical protein